MVGGTEAAQVNSTSVLNRQLLSVLWQLARAWKVWPNLSRHASEVHHPPVLTQFKVSYSKPHSTIKLCT